MPEEYPTVPLLASRLVAPPPPEPVVLRPRLLRRLDTGTCGPVTLLRAPAGWGKTTLLAAWVRATEPASAWLSVEVGDTAERLWSYLAVALDAADLPADRSVERLAAALAARDQPVVLVLDDLHRVTDPAALAGLEFLLRHAGQRLRLVVAARTDPALPLHRWRLRGELTEIDADELAFTTDEVADLLTAHAVAVPPASVPTLRERTGGWPAGLCFAALAARSAADPAAVVTGFGGEQPDVAGYLRDEILTELPAADVDLLRQLAVAGTVCGDLAAALVGSAGGDGPLADLARSTGFLRPDGLRPGWYRCQPLLADLLRADLARLPDRQLPMLHSRAAGWYAGQGRPAEALRHALAAGDWDHATELVLVDWPELVPYDPEPAGPPPTVPPADRFDRDPELALALAVDRARAADRAAADHLRAALAAARDLPAPRRDRLRWLAAALDVALARLTGDPAGVRAAAARLRTLTGAPAGPADDPRSGAGDRADGHLVAGTADALADLAEGDLTGAGAAFDRLAAGARQAGRPRTELLCRSRAALAAAWHGRLREAERDARETLGGPATPTDRSHAYLALAVVALYRDQPGAAEADLALADGPGYDPTTAAVAAYCRAQLGSDPGTVRPTLARARNLLAGRPRARAVTDRLLAAEVDHCAARGDPGAARELLAAVDESTVGPELAVARARIELYAGDPAAAGRALPRWDAPDADRWPRPVRLDAALLDALLARHAGDPRRAGRTVERVLELAEADGHRRVLTRAVPGVRDLLAEHLDSGTAHWTLVADLLRDGGPTGEPARRGGAPERGLDEPLTERELTILRYLQSILSNVEIASELSLSVNTVKTHVRNIYRKLDATRRREAVRRARELHLI
ncbi:LuxR family transcriptional regulator, maltose regulon positive regulatory protein [Micromonospora pallida]|uniref:LuxR family transcriptional regulator, maltose regulon positive regulatory protein n=1 Tax=Micromonospora pallida TaxID=145854 RepID=A0A1C6RJ93_9ACTN|nr:LuxR C-terminal-related transcriptional regulator [Micromonospora pallida]SCL17241.1 LuxR family transcriptional regulator, maltose regulon positive regulatory protein [Micromonospora pallida]